MTIKPNQIVKIGSITGVVEGFDLYQPLLVNVFNSTVQRVFPQYMITEILSEEYVGKPLFAFQVFEKLF